MSNKQITIWKRALPVTLHWDERKKGLGFAPPPWPQLCLSKPSEPHIQQQIFLIPLPIHQSPRSPIPLNFSWETPWPDQLIWKEILIPTSWNLHTSRGWSYSFLVCKWNKDYLINYFSFILLVVVWKTMS